MLQSYIVNLAYKALLLILILSGPPILISLFFGLGVAIFQAATQIQEQNLAFTVKLITTTLTLIMLGNWLGAQIMQFGMEIFHNFPRVVGG